MRRISVFILNFDSYTYTITHGCFSWFQSWWTFRYAAIAEADTFMLYAKGGISNKRLPTFTDWLSHPDPPCHNRPHGPVWLSYLDPSSTIDHMFRDDQDYRAVYYGPSRSAEIMAQAHEAHCSLDLQGCWPSKNVCVLLQNFWFLVIGKYMSDTWLTLEWFEDILSY